MQYDTIDIISGRIYCPSTDEVIFSLDELLINEEAKALIAAWYSVAIDQPVFNNSVLKDDWENFMIKHKDNPEQDILDTLYNFLEEYKAPEWRVYEIQTYGSRTGPVYNSDWYVVLADTIIEGNES